ncbi:hypothetical protein [Streptomyces sp.]|uniref:hypothetical protein n=1 Tax=Streptomyces sp. TaxID=1931 RepID=UPI002F3E48A4
MRIHTQEYALPVRCRAAVPRKEPTVGRNRVYPRPPATRRAHTPTPGFATVDGQRLLAATTVTGGSPCYATNVAYRLDAPSAQSFLAPFTALP